ncbi:MAG: helix-turn-helix transcriptional regulator [Roseicyclus sp.]|nr:helix-turn-helix transcriptional regulator [Roseicyclus sp.]MBO6625542.1 helix-turn-helix transcriptional regulator [Roseicyclus sp.]MBO6920944.1 helix-turn-helix transcriptional regulator [Roseicyclus sp.]
MGVHSSRLWLDTARLSSTRLPGGGTEQLLRADYFEMEAGPMAPVSLPDHCLLIPLQPDAAAGLQRRDGRQTPLDLPPGSMVVMPVGAVCSWEWRAPVNFLLIRAHPERIQHFIQGDLRVLTVGSRLDGSNVLQDPALRDWALQMKIALEEPGPGQAVLFDALARVFVVTLVRRYAITDDAPFAETGGLTTERYARLLDYIDRRIDQPLRTPELAHHLGMSDSALVRAIKQTTGITPQALVMRRRLDAAKTRLRDPALSLGAIAMATGFADQAHLSRSFKSAVGMTPSGYRRQKLN